MRASFADSFSSSFESGMPVQRDTMNSMSTSSTDCVPLPLFFSHSRLSSSSRCCRSFSFSRSAAAFSNSCASRYMSFSRRTRSSSRSISFSSGGGMSAMRRVRDEASSMTSMALSGSWRSVMYRSARCTAALIASSVIFTRWCASYLCLSPRMISIASGTVGALTMTGWNRRSSAPSFSMYLRYSSSVVAPMVWISPRESAGFSMLDASIAPSAAPAPISVCSSSRKRTTFSDCRISFITALSRSSNCPRYFVPATRAPRSSWRSRLFTSTSGTSWLTIFCARPSTIAVLPTPGSPIRTGLFFVRRARIWMTRSISCSRPITGSSLLSRASCVRSRANSSSTGVCERFLGRG